METRAYFPGWPTFLPDCSVFAHEDTTGERVSLFPLITDTAGGCAHSCKKEKDLITIPMMITSPLCQDPRFLFSFLRFLLFVPPVHLSLSVLLISLPSLFLFS